MNDQFLNEIKKINPHLTKVELQAALPYFHQKKFSAKEVISSAGKTCDQLYFSPHSISRCYYLDQEGNEQTLWMKPENTFFTEYKSFTSGAPSGFSLQFYEETEAYCISREDLMQLYKNYNGWALFGIHLTEHLHTVLIDVFVNLLSNDATRNYQYIEYAFPRFIQVAPLKDIASMLQISPVSLSRIRSGNQTKN